jgi:hypothetical protein
MLYIHGTDMSVHVSCLYTFGGQDSRCSLNLNVGFCLSETGVNLSHHYFCYVVSLKLQWTSALPFFRLCRTELDPTPPYVSATVVWFWLYRRKSICLNVLYWSSTTKSRFEYHILLLLGTLGNHHKIFYICYRTSLATGKEWYSVSTNDIVITVVCINDSEPKKSDGEFSMISFKTL